MDNLTVHHSRLVQAHMKELDITPIFNVPYSPEYNPIEVVFSLLKRTFKQIRLGRFAMGERLDFKAGIR